MVIVTQLIISKMAVNKQLGDMGMSALGTSGAYRGMNVKRKATRRLKTSISMYMPSDDRGIIWCLDIKMNQSEL